MLLHWATGVRVWPTGQVQAVRAGALNKQAYAGPSARQWPHFARASAMRPARAHGGRACAWSTVSVMVLSLPVRRRDGVKVPSAHSRPGGAAVLSGMGEPRQGRP
jgi:hypothetical protein